MSNSQQADGRYAGLDPGRRLAVAFAFAAVICGAALWLALSSASGATASDTKTFNFTGGEQLFTVPNGVTSLNVVAIGGKGGSSGGGTGGIGAAGGFGATATGTVAVTPGQVLFVEVAGNGGLISGGFNGGGNGADGSDHDGGGGGGATDIRTISRAGAGNTLNSRLVIAGGGGGGGGNSGGTTGTGGGIGGHAGGPGFGGTGQDGFPGTGDAGSSAGAGGGSQTAGGGPVGLAGSLGQGGNGQASAPGVNGGNGAGGGGGKFGGGGSVNGSGGGAAAGGGGGGSTSFATTVTSSSFNVDTTGTPQLRITFNAGGGGNKSGLKFGKVIRNKKKGTALLPVTVPGSGTLSIGGKGVVKKRAGLVGAALRLFKDAPQAGTYKLKVKSKGKKREKLFDTGKVKVKAIVTFKPSSGDAVSASKKIRLKKN